MERNTRTIGVLGTGTMGAGIVQVASQAGYRVVPCDCSVEALERAQLYVRDGLTGFAQKDHRGRSGGRLRPHPLDGKRGRDERG